MWPDQVELPLNRERPVVLQRAGARAGGTVGELGPDELPVLVVERRRDHFVDVLNLLRDGGPEICGDEHGHQDDHRTGDQPIGDAGVVVTQPAAWCALVGSRPGASEVSEQLARQEVCGEYEEHIHASRHPSVSEDVEQDDEGQRDSADTVDLVHVAGFHGPERGALRMQLLSRSS